MAPAVEARAPESGIGDAPLRMLRDGARVSARLLVRLWSAPGESRRERLARLNRWAQGAEVSVAVLPASAASLFADLRALGFADAGPLPRYAAAVRPGLLRRSLSAVFFPPPRKPEGVRAILRPAAAPEMRALLDRLGRGFGAVAGGSEEREPGSGGVRLVRSGQPLAAARWEPGEPESLGVTEWLAPPGEPDLAAPLAEAVREAAAGRRAREVVFETTHEALGKGLLRARFWPRRSRARVLVRQGGARDRTAPSVADWHLTAPTRIGPPPAATGVVESGVPLAPLSSRG